MKDESDTDIREPSPACPWCRTARYVRPSGANLKAWYCPLCRREFEAGDDGLVGYGPPEKFAERAERDSRFAARRRQRRNRR